MACHVPLYRALLELLRAIAVCPPLMPLLLPLDADDDSSVSISSLLEKMKQCVDTYASRLKYVSLSGWQSAYYIVMIRSLKPYPCYGFHFLGCKLNQAMSLCNMHLAVKTSGSCLHFTVC